MSTILTKALAIALVSILMVVMVAPQPAYRPGRSFVWHHGHP